MATTPMAMPAGTSLPAGLRLSASNHKSVLLVSPQTDVRTSLRAQLEGLRWVVFEAAGGAEALMQQDVSPAASVLLDDWLPDLEAGELARRFHALYPTVDLLLLNGAPAVAGAPRGSRRNELLHVLREHEAAAHSPTPSDSATWLQAPVSAAPQASLSTAAAYPTTQDAPAYEPCPPATIQVQKPLTFVLPQVAGASACMEQLGRMVRLVAVRSATVLIEGDTGTGKELVAKAVHRLSPRAGKPFVVLNCAAIPEQLLEAELFGHTRGAFTGAVTARTGRIEAAHGGTLFLDEIGEMPLPLQAKMLRFLECGELQRIGDNDVSRVDVRIVAATHQHLQQRAAEGTFRLDLLHRLAVFPVRVPSLRDRMDDLPMLASLVLDRLAEQMPKRTLTADAMHRLQAHDWPGNVRELAHVLERACILTAEQPEIRPEHLLLY